MPNTTVPFHTPRQPSPREGREPSEFDEAPQRRSDLTGRRKAGAAAAFAFLGEHSLLAAVVVAFALSPFFAAPSHIIIDLVCFLFQCTLVLPGARIIWTLVVLRMLAIGFHFHSKKEMKRKFRSHSSFNIKFVSVDPFA
jgi:hypothetical protein